MQNQIDPHANQTDPHANQIDPHKDQIDQHAEIYGETRFRQNVYKRAKHGFATKSLS